MDNTFDNSAKRLVKNIVVQAAADIAIIPNVSLMIGGKNIKEWIGNPYGIIPFAMSASKEDLIAVAQALEVTKYQLIKAGQYYKAWLYGRRQRIIEGVLSGTTNISLNITK